MQAISDVNVCRHIFKISGSSIGVMSEGQGHTRITKYTDSRVFCLQASASLWHQPVSHALLKTLSFAYATNLLLRKKFYTLNVVNRYGRK